MKTRTRIAKVLFPNTPHGVRKRDFHFLMGALAVTAVLCVLFGLLLWSCSKPRVMPREPEVYGETQK